MYFLGIKKFFYIDPKIPSQADFDFVSRNTLSTFIHPNRCRTDPASECDFILITLSP